MKKILLTIVLMVLCCLAGVFATPISPTSCDNLRTLVEANCSADYELQNNLDCSTETGLQPICSSARYSGIFDGQNHTITGLTIYLPTTDYVGLFGRVGVSGFGTIKNLGLIDVNITGRDATGGLAGSATDGSIINRCFVTGIISGRGSSLGIGGVGGLVGGKSGGTVNDSYADCTVTGAERVGGLIGTYDSNGKIVNCYATGSVTGTTYLIGGLVGYNQADIKNSYTVSTVNGPSPVGGLVGINSGSVSNCYWSGNQANCCDYSSCTCTNEATPANFYDSTHLVYTAGTPQWDFINVWQENVDDYPTLPEAETHLACIDFTCQEVEGPGEDQCASNEDCLGTGEEIPEFSTTTLILTIILVGLGITLITRKKQQ
ncbi:hypothetical protein KY345_04885 [Candidatus Woesearchaeota archaeon]|nr:hypothetical protein [Candidatus Woesearchaeota archaeon]